LPVCEKIGAALACKDKFHVVAITSTVMPGDCDGPIKAALEEASGGICGEQFGLVYNPEFIALGSVIKDFLKPDFVLLGANDPLSYARIAQIYESCVDSPVIKSMTRVNAELTKLALNSYVTAKISFANTLCRICETIPGCDIDVVTDAIGTDSRIGKKYLKGAISYGGPCFPRDNRALATLAPEFADIPKTVDSFNRKQIKWLADFVLSIAGQGGITILGKTYKPGTDVTEESAGLLLQQELESRAVPVANTYLGNTVVIMQPDPKFADLDYSGKLVIDCWRGFPELDRPDVDYYPLGLG
jgi:UDPglucose 6-dehydrogenase